jgi:hypothetical protein
LLGHLQPKEPEQQGHHDQVDDPLGSAAEQSSQRLQRPEDQRRNQDDGDGEHRDVPRVRLAV